MSAIVLTRADCLAGQAEITLLTRTGEEVKATIKALPWRAALQASEAVARGRIADGIAVALKEQPKPLCDDDFLDALPLASLTAISKAIFDLSNGSESAQLKTAPNV